MSWMRSFVAAIIVSTIGSAAAATFTVTNDSPSSFLSGSLPWAIEQAELTPASDTILFSIGSGPKTITVPFLLTIFNPVIIDGTSQPGYSGIPLISIRLSANGVFGPLNCLANNCVFRGLAFPGNTDDIGIFVQGDDCTFQDCWIGTDPSFASSTGGTGITLSGADRTIISRCLIGNRATGIVIDNCAATWVYGCAIGTSFDGTQILPISDNGIEIYGGPASTASTIGPLASEPGNLITNCGQDGVALSESASTVITGNRIFGVGDLPIDQNFLNPNTTFNDNFPPDGDIAFGGAQNYPELTSVIRNGSFQIQGTLKSQPSRSYLVEFFANRIIPSGRPQGEFLLGSQLVTTDASGDAILNASFGDTLSAGLSLTYSATARRSDRSWGTSEFSNAVLANLATHYRDTDPEADPGWIPSGVDSGPEYTLDPSSPDDVDVDTVPGAVRAIVRSSSGRYRIAGWRNPGILRTPAATGLFFVRGKFYVYTSNAAGAPVNTVPNFRLRLDNEGAVVASSTYQYAFTGNDPVPHEPFYGLLNDPNVELRAGASLRPSSNPLKPSLYRIDMALPVVAASQNTLIGASFESYSTETPADGTLALTEMVLASYQPNLSGPSFSAIYSYNPDALFDTVAGTVSGPSTVTTGQFNVENNFEAGRRQAIDLPGEVPLSQLAQVSETGGVSGAILDTGSVPADKLGVGLLSATANTLITRPRIEPGKLYLAVYYASSDLPSRTEIPGTPVQGGMSFQLQTAGGAVTNRLELSGPANFYGAGTPARQILEQLLPSSQCENLPGLQYPFPAGEDGGAYIAVMSSPMDAAIRQDVGGALGPLGAEPGPGIDAASARDISVGMNVISQPTTLRVSPTLVVPWAPPNRAKVRFLGMGLIRADQINDGGYGY